MGGYKFLHKENAFNSLKVIINIYLYMEESREDNIRAQVPIAGNKLEVVIIKRYK